MSDSETRRVEPVAAAQSVADELVVSVGQTSEPHGIQPTETKEQ